MSGFGWVITPRVFELLSSVFKDKKCCHEHLRTGSLMTVWKHWFRLYFPWESVSIFGKGCVCVCVCVCTCLHVTPHWFPPTQWFHDQKSWLVMIPRTHSPPLRMSHETQQHVETTSHSPASRGKCSEAGTIKEAPQGWRGKEVDDSKTEGRQSLFPSWIS